MVQCSVIDVRSRIRLSALQKSIIDLRRRARSRVRPVGLVNCAAIQASASERQTHRQVTRSARPWVARVAESPAWHVIGGCSVVAARWWLLGGGCSVVAARWWLLGGGGSVVAAPWWLLGGGCSVVAARWWLLGG